MAWDGEIHLTHTEKLLSKLSHWDQLQDSLKTIIGCGHDSSGVINRKGSGIVGLGPSATSLVSQLSTSIAGKFSHCLVPFDKANDTTKLNFGTNAVVSGPGAVTTPLATGEDVYYTLTLEAISVGPTKITSTSAKAAGGNIIIDSGTALTFLPSDLYTVLKQH